MAKRGREEKIETMILKVDGTAEPYNREKLVASIVKAGGSRSLAEKIADRVEKKIAGSKEVTSRTVRSFVLSELKRRAPNVYDNWTFYDRLVKNRITYEMGKFVVVERGSLYLGREVRDIGKPGLSDIEEVAAIIRELQEDYDHGIPKKVINARTWVLFMAILKSKHMDPETKEKAIRMVNDFRAKFGWEPLEPKKPIE
ncbi:MAG: ATP cone domain-containing protein [Crenarchaeota archaeon]|nr:ATP cone domain-containing protein [Thermoproteota archaeon]